MAPVLTLVERSCCCGGSCAEVWRHRHPHQQRLGHQSRLYVCCRHQMLSSSDVVVIRCCRHQMLSSSDVVVGFCLGCGSEITRLGRRGECEKLCRFCNDGIFSNRNGQEATRNKSLMISLYVPFERSTLAQSNFTCILAHILTCLLAPLFPQLLDA
jgi:hypothetical protein